MRNLFTRLFASRPTTTRPSHRTFLSVEGLDARVMPSKVSIIYEVAIHNTSSSKVIKETQKKNLLASVDLPPGSYSMSHDTEREIVGPKVVARDR